MHSIKSGHYKTREGSFYCQCCGREIAGESNDVGADGLPNAKKMLKICGECFEKYQCPESELHQRIRVLVGGL